jgi:hypothetical protein
VSVDTIEEALYSRLTGFSGLSSLISTRVYPCLLPQGTEKPACYYEIDETRRESTDAADDTYRITDLTVTVVADSYRSAKAVTDQVELALARWTQSTPVEVIETLVTHKGIMAVQDTNEFIAVTEVNIQYFIP